MPHRPLLAVRVSIRSPHQSKGRHGRGYWCVALGQVSIRSPHQSKGRHECPLIPYVSDPVSIRSPHQSKGRQRRPTWRAPSPAFQSAPLTKARGDGTLQPQVRLYGQVSIRSPHQSKGRLQTSNYFQLFFKVSIRSPHQSKGRHASPCPSLQVNVFQSAPLTKARGDANAQPVGDRVEGFNPLPSPKQGETPATGIKRQSQCRFNPLPSPKQGETRTATSRRRCGSCFNPLPSPKQGET